MELVPERDSSNFPHRSLVYYAGDMHPFGGGADSMARKISSARRNKILNPTYLLVRPI
jgi:hypothetical protein